MTRRTYGFNSGEGHRSVCEWGDGDLPAPYAEGDLIDVPEGAKTLERMHGMGPGRYIVTYCASIDEGDAWYARITPARRMGKGEQREWSDRLHVAWASRSTWPEDHDWLAGCTMVETVDPAGLALRERMLAEGWSMPPVYKCPTCLREMPKFSWEIMQERLARQAAPTESMEAKAIVDAYLGGMPAPFDGWHHIDNAHSDLLREIIKQLVWIIAHPVAADGTVDG